MKHNTLAPPISRLLVLAEQPSSLRDCYDLVADFMASLKEPAPQALLTSLPAMEPDEAGRLGYLLSAASHVAPESLDESWVGILQRLEESMHSDDSGTPMVSVRPWTLLRCEPELNELDDVAGYWGMRKGLAFSKLRQIANTGRC